MTKKADRLEELRDELRIAAATNGEDAGEVISRLLVAADQQLSVRVTDIGVVPSWTSLQSISQGAAGVSLLLDVVALCAEAGIQKLGLAGADLDNRAHAVVDLWARAEAGRSLLMELFDQWPQGAPTERVLALKDTLRALCIDSAARVLEGNFGDEALIPFFKKYISLSE